MKKKIACFCTALLAISMLGGCGGSDAEKPLNEMSEEEVTVESGSVDESEADALVESSDAEKPLSEIEVEKYVTLGEYKGMEVTVAPISVDESEVDALVDSAYSNYVTAENGGVTDRAVAVGDTANIDYVGKKDGVAFEGGTAQGYNLAIGSGQFIAGFEEGLVGVMPGETVDLNLTFPEEYHSADLAGQAVVFTVTVNYIVPAEKEDAVVATMGIEGVTTVEGLRQYAYDYLYSNAEYNYTTTVENEVFNAFMNSCVFEEIPQDIIANYEVKAAEVIEQQALIYGMDAQSFVSTYYEMEYDAFLAEYSNEAAKQDLALQAVSNSENLNLSDEELDARLLEYANSVGFATVEELLGEEDKETYRGYFMYEDVISFLKENAVINNQ